MFDYQQNFKEAKEIKEKGLGMDKINSQLISLYLVKRDRNDVVKTIPFVFQVESDLKMFKEVMSSRDCIF